MTLRAARTLFVEDGQVSAPMSAICAALPEISHAGVKIALSGLHRKGILGVIEVPGGAMSVYASPEALRQYMRNINTLIGRARRTGNSTTVRPPQQTVLIEETPSSADEAEEAEAEVLDTLVRTLKEKDAEIEVLREDLRRSLNKQRVAEGRQGISDDLAVERLGQLGLVKAELNDTKRLLAEQTAVAGRVPELEEEIRQLRERAVVAPELAERLRKLEL